MTNYPTDVHGPASAARTPTYKVAHCQVCGVHWQVRGDSDKKGCKFCGAPESAIVIESEHLTYR